MGYFEWALSLDGTLGAREQKQRSLLFYMAVLGAVFTNLDYVFTLARRKDRPANLLSGACMTVGCLIIIACILCKRRLTTAVVVGAIYFLSFSVFLWDLEARMVASFNWPLVVLMVDVLLVMQVPARYSTGLVCFTVVWLVFMACEECLRFGLFDLPGLFPQEGEFGRKEHWRKRVECETLPCAVDFPPETLATSLSVFVMDFVATRGFAREVLKEQEAMQRTIATVQDIASLLAGYDVEGVARMLEAQETLLPEEMRATLQTLEENLRKYRPYLPAALFEEDEVDGVQHTSVAPPGLESGTATIVFTDIRASTSIWECAPDGMRAGLKIHNRVMREVMQMFGGYEVKTIGDAFMIAFETTADGVNFALQVQEKLLAADWPASLLEDAPICAPQDSLWGGLTVRIGVNTGPVAIEQNTLTGRTDYFGHTVNVASRLESTCTPGAVAVPSDLWTSDCCTCSAVVGQSEALDLKGVSDKMFVCPVWPVSLWGRNKVCLHIPKAVNKRHAPELCESISHSESAVLQVTRSTSVTIGTADLALGDGGANSLHEVNCALSTLTVALDQSGGSLVTLLGSRVCVSWNVTRSAPAHMENAIRFAQRMSGATLEGAGLASGPVQHGDVGARRQRFVTVMGTTVRRSWTLCEEAVRDGVVCLFEPPEGTTLPTALEQVLSEHKTSYNIYRVLSSTRNAS